MPNDRVDVNANVNVLIPVPKYDSVYVIEWLGDLADFLDSVAESTPAESDSVEIPKLLLSEIVTNLRRAGIIIER